MNFIEICGVLKLINKAIFQLCAVELTEVEAESESKEYSAHNFMLNKQKVKFRLSKITPTKTGQFVAIWKRNKNGTTEPPNIDDEFELYMIATRNETKFGIFIFNKKVLSENRVITNKIGKGKRGIRVYPTWDIAANKQAKKTQNWQEKCFLEFSKDNQIDLFKAKKLLNLE